MLYLYAISGIFPHGKEGPVVFQSQEFSELEEDILECLMYPREDPKQQSEVTFNVFQKGIKWLSELSWVQLYYDQNHFLLS